MKTIDNPREEREAQVTMGHSADVRTLYSQELARQDPATGRAVTLAYTQERLDWVIKEDRKAVDMDRAGSIDRLAQSLDERMAKSELEELGWKDREGLSAVMLGLEMLASRDWQRAANLWEKYRPGDIDKPGFIDGNEIDTKPKRDAGQALASADNTVGREQKDADRGKPEPKEAEFLTPESIRKRFIQAESRFYFRDEENRLAFEDKGKRPVVVKAVVARDEDDQSPSRWAFF